jgi:hypothetical protein
MLTVAPAELKARGKRLVQRLRKVLPAAVKVSLTSGFSQAGGGALPLLELPTTLMAVEVERTSPQQREEVEKLRRRSSAGYAGQALDLAPFSTLMLQPDCCAPSLENDGTLGTALKEVPAGFFKTHEILLLTSFRPGK